MAVKALDVCHVYTKEFHESFMPDSVAKWVITVMMMNKATACAST